MRHRLEAVTKFAKKLAATCHPFTTITTITHVTAATPITIRGITARGAINSIARTRTTLIKMVIQAITGMAVRAADSSLTWISALITATGSINTLANAAERVAELPKPLPTAITLMLGAGGAAGVAIQVNVVNAEAAGAYHGAVVRAIITEYHPISVEVEHRVAVRRLVDLVVVEFAPAEPALRHLWAVFAANEAFLSAGFFNIFI